MDTQIVLGGHRGFGCTDHLFYQRIRPVADLPVENTLRSFEMAFAHGASYVELDVVMSADGELFVLHNVRAQDHFFECPIPPKRLNKLLFKDIKDHPTGSMRSGKIATFAEALACIATHVSVDNPWVVNVEIKGVQGAYQSYENKFFIEKIAQTVEASAIPPEKVLFSSFCFENIMRMSHLLPQAKYGILFCENRVGGPIYRNNKSNIYFQYWPLKKGYIDFALSVWQQRAHPQSKLGYIHPETMTVTKPIVAYAAERGLGINIWDFFAAFDRKRTEKINKIIGLCDEYNVSLTAITDYLPQMQRLFVKK